MPADRPQTIPQRIAARRRARARRRGNVFGAASGCLLTLLVVVGFAVGDSTIEPAPCEPAAHGETVVAPSEPCAEPPVAGIEPAPAEPVPATDGEVLPLEEDTTTPVPQEPTAGAEPSVPAEPAPIEEAPAPPTDHEGEELPVPEEGTPAPAPVLPDPAAAQPPVPAPAPQPAPVEDADPGVLVADPTITIEPTVLAQREQSTRSRSRRRHKRTSARRPPAATAPATTSPKAPGRDTVTAPGPETVEEAATEAITPSERAVTISSLSSIAPPALLAGDGGDFPGPAALVPIYQAASAEYGIPWSVLASINEIETGFGRNVAVSSAGAQGWMQFMPSTWAAYGVDGDGDGVANPQDPVDAIFAAANYLKASGAEKDLPKAVFAYNHADWYVNKVLSRARTFAEVSAPQLVGLTARGLRDAELLHDDAEIDSIGRAMLLSDEALREQVVRDSAIYPCGQEDVRAGRIDRRVLLLLEALAHADQKPTVSSFQCGHGVYTASGNVSHHTTGTAVDIAAINGTSILGHQGAGSITEKALATILELPPALHADQVISLMTVAGHPNTISMGDHADHIHVGFRPVALPKDDQRADHTE